MNPQLAFSKVDGWRDSVWIQGSHDLALPFLGRVFATNLSKWESFNADALLMKRIAGTEGWGVYSWCFHRSLNSEWVECHRVLDLVSALGEMTHPGKSVIRIYANHEVTVQVHGYDENIERLTSMVKKGIFGSDRLFGIKRSGEQAVAPNRSLPPSQKSTSTVRGSED